MLQAGSSLAHIRTQEQTLFMSACVRSNQFKEASTKKVNCAVHHRTCQLDQELTFVIVEMMNVTMDADTFLSDCC